VQKAESVLARHRESVRRAHEVGVKIAMGTDCGTPFNAAGRNALELELMTQNGLTAAETLMATTRVAADAIGVLDRAGTLEAGKRADVIIVDGDPLADVRILQDSARIAWVVKAGQIVKRP
jgi:imidazolonepropionase-like amidohydrolase